MSYSSGSRRDLSESFSDFLDYCAKGVLYIGAGLSVIAIALLVYTCFAVSGDAVTHPGDATSNIDTFGKMLFFGVIGVGVGSGYLFWGEELLGAAQLLLAAALYFSPLYMPMLLGDKKTEAVSKALGSLQTGGTLLGIIAVAILAFDIVTRTRQRIKVGVKADQLKYGKGIQEETTKQNVFLGKCWQLPFCRKFVRDRCPIYHSKRTCWKEKVGCMCEEQVIRNAMENKVVPKDALLASKMIPQNHKITLAAKQERCRNCVIYNEHQRHKYKAAVPGVVIGFILFYGLFRNPLLDLTSSFIEHVNKIIKGATYDHLTMQTPPIFVEMLLVVGFIITLSYSMKVLEYLIFKLKV